MSESSEMFYRGSYLTAQQIRDEIANFWTDAKTDPRLQAELSAIGLSVGTLDDIGPGSIRVGADRGGIDPQTVLLVITFVAPTINRVLKDMWSTLLLPRIRRKWGDDALGDEVDKEDDGEQADGGDG